MPTRWTFMSTPIPSTITSYSRSSVHRFALPPPPPHYSLTASSPISASHSDLTPLHTTAFRLWIAITQWNMLQLLALSSSYFKRILDPKGGSSFSLSLSLSSSQFTWVICHSVPVLVPNIRIYVVVACLHIPSLNVNC